MRFEVVKVKLSASGAKKILKNINELFKSDIDHSLKGITPGQWCTFELPKKNLEFFGYINPHVESNRPMAYLVNAQSKDPWNYIETQLEKAVSKRSSIYGLGLNSRLVYGQGDGLPGLIVDSYSNSIFIQVNTAGMDIFRKQIQNFFQKLSPEKEVIFLDNENYRRGEGLPQFENPESDIKFIQIEENELKYEIGFEKKQKIGYYYDHRLNRQKAGKLLKFIQKNEAEGLDLFCYIGSWGMNLLHAGLKHVDFVDQGDFAAEIERNLGLNNFTGKGDYFRSNVFDFLKQNSKRYDVICSDPPAFCKSKKEKQRAIDGYVKLHRLCLEKLKPGGILLACSCTHYVDHEEFQNSVMQAAKLSKRVIQLIDVGMQGLDHPIESLYQKESYLKYYAYYVE